MGWSAATATKAASASVRSVFEKPQTSTWGTTSIFVARSRAGPGSARRPDGGPGRSGRSRRPAARRGGRRRSERTSSMLRLASSSLSGAGRRRRRTTRRSRSRSRPEPQVVDPRPSSSSEPPSLTCASSSPIQGSSRLEARRGGQLGLLAEGEVLAADRARVQAISERLLVGPRAVRRGPGPARGRRGEPGDRESGGEGRSPRRVTPRAVELFMSRALGLVGRVGRDMLADHAGASRRGDRGRVAPASPLAEIRTALAVL